MKKLLNQESKRTSIRIMFLPKNLGAPNFQRWLPVLLTILFATLDPNARGQSWTVTGDQTVGGSVGIGTTTPGARLDINGDTFNSPPLLRLQREIGGLYPFGPNDYFSPLFLIEVKIPKFSTATYSTATVFTVTAESRVGINTKTPEAQLHVRDAGFYDNKQSLVIDDPLLPKRSFFIVPKLGGYGYNNLSAPGDTGIFWTDGMNGQGNKDAGLVIAPWAASWAGLRISADGDVGIGWNIKPNPDKYKLGVNGAVYAKGLTVDGPILTTGNVSIGTGLTPPPNPHSYRLAVDGTIGAKGLSVHGLVLASEIIVDSTSKWPDFVFEESYQPMPLDRVEAFVQKEKHLPGIPSAGEVQKNGLNLGEMNGAMLKHIEELTLHVIEMKKENRVLRQRLEVLEQR